MDGVSVCSHTYTHTFLSSATKKAWELQHPTVTIHSVSRLWLLNTTLNRKEPGLLGETAASTAGPGRGWGEHTG